MLFCPSKSVSNLVSYLLQLLKRKETILLFPGGVKEAYHKKGEEYQLFWPEKIDFVRMAAMFDALIVPFAAIGMADSVNMIFDGNPANLFPNTAFTMLTLTI